MLSIPYFWKERGVYPLVLKKPLPSPTQYEGSEIRKNGSADEKFKCFFESDFPEVGKSGPLTRQSNQISHTLSFGSEFKSWLRHPEEERFRNLDFSYKK